MVTTESCRGGVVFCGSKSRAWLRDRNWRLLVAISCLPLQEVAVGVGAEEGDGQLGCSLPTWAKCEGSEGRG